MLRIPDPFSSQTAKAETLVAPPACPPLSSLTHHRFQLFSKACRPLCEGGPSRCMVAQQRNLRSRPNKDTLFPEQTSPSLGSPNLDHDLPRKRICTRSPSSNMNREYDLMDENEPPSRRNFDIESDDDDPGATSTMSTPPSFASASASRSRKRSLVARSQPRQIRTPSSPMASTIPGNLLPSAPASPPTPAPSPTPTQRAPDWSTAAEHEDHHVRDIRARFADMNDAEKQRLLAELLNMCNSHQLAFVHDFVSPRLKKDPFTTLPTELCLRVRTSFLYSFDYILSTTYGKPSQTNNSPADPYLYRRSNNACPFFPSVKALA